MFYIPWQYSSQNADSHLVHHQYPSQALASSFLNLSWKHQDTGLSLLKDLGDGCRHWSYCAFVSEFLHRFLLNTRLCQKHLHWNIKCKKFSLDFMLFTCKLQQHLEPKGGDCQLQNHGLEVLLYTWIVWFIRICTKDKQSYLLQAHQHGALLFSSRNTNVDRSFIIYRYCTCCFGTCNTSNFSIVCIIIM